MTTAIEKQAENIQHKKFEGLIRAQIPPNQSELTLITWANRYLQQEVAGVQSKNTLQAKVKDLEAFIKFFQNTNGHLRIEDWMKRDTEGFLESLEHEGRKPSSINRAFATIRHFARWVADHNPSPFRYGSPVKGIKERTLPNSPPKQLSQITINRLKKAADKRVIIDEGRKNARPLRNRAIFHLLLGTGLRVEELCNLNLEQFQGKWLRNVKGKGKQYRDIPIPSEARNFLMEYIEKERSKDAIASKEPCPALFLTSSGKRMSRFEINKILQKLARTAEAECGEKIHLHPHALRHTYAARLLKKTGNLAFVKDKLGHTSFAHTAKYVQMTEEEEEMAVDGM